MVFVGTQGKSDTEANGWIEQQRLPREQQMYSRLVALVVGSRGEALLKHQEKRVLCSFSVDPLMNRGDETDH